MRWGGDYASTSTMRSGFACSVIKDALRFISTMARLLKRDLHQSSGAPGR